MEIISTAIKSENDLSNDLPLKILCSFLIILMALAGCNQNKSDLRTKQVIEDAETMTPPLNHKRAMPLNYEMPLNSLLDSLNSDSSNIYIFVDKSDFLLSVRVDTLVIKQYPIVLGGNPVDDKLRQGDGCTPEGDFKVLAKYPHRAWSRFIFIDYPNSESLAKHKAAKAKGLISPESTPGGEIGIHGVYQNRDINIDLRNNWTAGCISLKNKDIRELYEYVNIGTRVVIQK
jgi:murein L,D-transpeptidase YafK